MTSSPSARVVARDVVVYQEIVSKLGIEFDACPSDESFVLVERGDRLELRPPGEATLPGIQSVFPPDQGRASGGRNPLVRAFGKSIDTIFDLTAGLGSDAYRLAAAGHRVVAFERHPAVYAVLITGWMSDCAEGRVSKEIAGRLEFVHAESAVMLDRIDRPRAGVYLDPMYPQPRRSKALPRRELQVLRRLLGEDDDAAKMVEAARPRSVRVVVKRPHRAPPLVPDVSFEISSKLVRFDVYVNAGKMGDTAT